MKQSTNLPDILCDLYQYNERLKTEFQNEVQWEAAKLGRKRFKARDSILVTCLRAGRGDKVRGALLQMLCDELGLDPEKEERALPGKLPNAKRAGADPRWRMGVCEVSGTSTKETLKLIRNAKPYKTSGARRRKMIDKLLEDTAAEQTRLFRRPDTELLIPFCEEAEGKVRKRHSKTQTPHEKSLVWLSAVEWLGERVSPLIKNLETDLERYCARCLVGRGADRYWSRAHHRLWQEQRGDQDFRLLETEITRLDALDNVDDLPRLLWERWPIEAEQIGLPKPTAAEMDAADSHPDDPAATENHAIPSKNTDLQKLQDAVQCADVVRAVGRKAGRSDKLAEKMKRHNYLTAITANKWYCQRADAIASFPHHKQQILRI